MPYNNKFEAFMGTLFHSWGGDTPQDAVWAANDFIEWAIEEFDIEVSARYSGEYKTTDGREWEELTKELYEKIHIRKP